ncbi:MAG: signal recognition particle protein [Deltaproteobacteria bacterium]|nr:signal recognition particle protein [Deltaproteobacteria bacterium]
MLDAVAKGFRAAKNKLTGKAELTEANIDDALRDIRVALLEADVEFNVAKRFLARVKEKSLGEVVQLKAKDEKGRLLAVQPGDHFIKICHDELEGLMGPVDTSLVLPKPGSAGERPAGIMMVGLQGSGKTTTTAKLANFLIKQGRKPLLVAADIYRPAAIEQLQQLGAKLDIPVFTEAGIKPPELAKKALALAGQKGRDVILYDTAGRLAIDEEMMVELEQVKAEVKPENILLVVDAMIGQDGVKTAAEFDRRLGLSGFILTKLDGDARGGAALSIKEVTGKPIKFLGMGETVDKLEEFRPEGLASRILGFGDIVGLMKDFEGVVDEDKAEADAEKILSGSFNLEDFVEQIKLVKKMGSVGDLLEKFPIFGELPEGVNFDDKELVRVEAVIGSMTKSERQYPEEFFKISPQGQLTLGLTRIQRIAKGSGQHPNQVLGLLHRFFGMQKVMKQIGGGPGGAGMGLLSRLPGFRQLAQLKAMKGMDPSELAGMFGMPDQMGGPMPMPGGKGSHQAALARARLMGFNQQPTRVMSDEEKKRLRDKKKAERQNKKKARKNKR